MNEKFLFKISLLCGLLGIFIILLILVRIDLDESDIASITLENVDEQAKIKGYIISLRETPGLYLLTVKDNTGSMPVVIFKDETLDLKENQIVEIEGTVVNYNNKPEIQAKIVKVF